MTREEAIRWLEDIHRRFNPTGENLENEGGDVHLQALDMAIEALSRDRPPGEWVNRERCQVDEDAYEVATCSECGAEITIEYPDDNYCPSCGATMKDGDK